MKHVYEVSFKPKQETMIFEGLFDAAHFVASLSHKLIYRDPSANSSIEKATDKKLIKAVHVSGIVNVYYFDTLQTQRKVVITRKNVL